MRRIVNDVKPHRWWHRTSVVGWGDGGTWFICKHKGCVKYARTWSERD